MENITRRKFIQTGSAAAIAALIGCQTNRSLKFLKDDEKYNVLFIMTDQHNPRGMGCAGHPQIKTPNMDRLAKEGVRFENAYCQTGQCCPSRFSIFTGRYAHSHGCRFNSVIENPKEVTVAEIFKKAGYSTASFGKHHMMLDMKYHGFDHVVDLPGYNEFMKSEGKPHSWWDGDFFPNWKERFGLPAGTTHADNDHHTAGFWKNQAIDYIREHKSQPFCAWLSFFGPHMPYVASKPWMDLYDAKSLELPPNYEDLRKNVPQALTELRERTNDLTDDEMREVLKCYMAYTSQIDYNIGCVLDELDRLGIADKTIVVYTADHGDMMGEHRAFRKAVFNYEGTVGIPMLIRLPGVLPENVTINELAGSIDLLPTLCDLTGLDFPESVQGKSLVPLMQGKETKWRDVIFSEIGYPHPFPTGVCIMARDKKFKYIYHDYIGKNFEELFDLKNDPGELKNLAENPNHKTTLDRLRNEVKLWNKNTDHAPLYPMSEWKQQLTPEDFKNAAAKAG